MVYTCLFFPLPPAKILQSLPTQAREGTCYGLLFHHYAMIRGIMYLTITARRICYSLQFKPCQPHPAAGPSPLLPAAAHLLVYHPPLMVVVCLPSAFALPAAAACAYSAVCAVAHEHSSHDHDRSCLLLLLTPRLQVMQYRPPSASAATPAPTSNWHSDEE